MTPSRPPAGDDVRRTTLVAHALAVLAVVTLVVACGVKVALAPHDTTNNIQVLLLVVSLLAVGWVLAWKRPDVSLGWLMLGITLFATLSGPLVLLGLAVQGVAPWATAAILSYGGNSYWAWLPVLGLLLTQMPLRFPTGRLPSPRWRWFSRYTIAVIVLDSIALATFGGSVGFGVANPFFVDWPHPLDRIITTIAQILLVIAFLGSIASLFVRYRRAAAVERAQLRWFYFALAITTGTLVLGWIENAVFGNDSAAGTAGVVARALDVLVGYTYLLIPLAILVAVLRSGLYAIDRIVSRTAAYAIVTLSVIVLYVAVVLIVSLVLPDLQAVGVALATLVAAALFLPLLRIVRSAVDRRFNRAQYDAQQVAERFGERIRTGADPSAVGDDLVSAVESALQPSAVGIWRRDAQ